MQFGTRFRMAMAVASAVAISSIDPAAAGPKSAGSLKDGPPPTYAAPDPGIAPIWQGLYWGASVGYGSGSSEHFYERNNNHGTATADLTGAAASLSLGYNYMLSPNIVVGVEGDIGLMDVSADDQVIFDGHVWKSRFGAFWGTARLRAGYLFGNTLVYATAGGAIMEVDEVGIGDAAGQTATNASARSGFVVGAGVEHAFSPAMSVKLEYLHMDFGRYEGLSENREAFFFDNQLDLFRVGLNMKY